MSVLKRISKYLSSGGKGQALDQEMIDKLTEIKNGLGPWQIHMAALCQKAFRQLSSTDSTLNFGLMQIFASGPMGGTHGEFNALELLQHMPEKERKLSVELAEILGTEPIQDLVVKIHGDGEIPEIAAYISGIRLILDRLISPPPSDQDCLRGYFLQLAEVVFGLGLMVSRQEPELADRLLGTEY